MNTARKIFRISTILLAIASTPAWSENKSVHASKPEAIAHTASVLETMSSAGYTYIRVEEKGGRFWIALPETEVGVGEKISFYEQMLMENFTSLSLNRTFDRILFVGAINKGTELPIKADAKSSPNKNTPKQHTEPQIVKDLESPVGRFIIQEVFDQKDELVGEVIEVKGKISKISAQIMGRDWVHIEDGTGTKSEKTIRSSFAQFKVM